MLLTVDTMWYSSPAWALFVKSMWLEMWAQASSRVVSDFSQRSWTVSRAPPSSNSCVLRSLAAV